MPPAFRNLADPPHPRLAPDIAPPGFSQGTPQARPRYLLGAVAAHSARLNLRSSDVLCRNPRGTLLRRDYYNREIWKPAIAGIGIPEDATFHDLRHTFASTALAEGVPISEVSRWLGHKPITTTVDLYGHLVPEASGRARDALDNAFRLTRMCPQSAPAAP